MKPAAEAQWLTVLVIIGILASCEAPPRPAERDLIAFTSRRSCWFSFYTVHPDGSRLRKLIDSVSVQDGPRAGWLDELGQPAWSFDRTRIAFVCADEGESAICVANADGSDAHVLPSAPGADRFPAWAPDGRIALSRITPQGAAIVAANADGSRVRALTHRHNDVDPTWSPDGNQIAFVRFTEDAQEIHVMNADGSHLRPLTRTKDFEGMLAWSPDGKRIAYIIGEPTQDIHVIDVDGSNRRNLTRSKDTEAWPTWSPDARRLAFMCGPTSGICVMNADGSERRQIVGGGGHLNMQPAWGP